MARRPPSSNERVAAFRERRRTLERHECEDPARRKRLEANPEKWLKWYLNNAYTRPFRTAHKKIIDGAINAQKTRGRFVVAAERGIGKSSVLWGLVLMFKLSGKEKFPVVLPYKDSDMKRALRFWINALCFNDRIAADYPEHSDPFVFSKGRGQKLSNAVWPDTGDPTGAQLRTSEGMIVFPDSLGAIGGATINGNPRGLNHPNEDGSILRPTLVFIDDPQSREVARSPSQVVVTCEVIDGDVAGLGDAGLMLPILMSGNCIVPGDVLDYYLNKPGWIPLRVSRIVTWPENFDQTKSECRMLWEEWNNLRVDGLQSRDGGKSARSFYRKNKRVMTAGMTVSNEDGYDKDQGQPDALYGAMESYYTLGHNAFMAERQQKPVVQTSTTFGLSPSLILSRKSGYARLTAPPGSVLCMGVDINYVGYNWSLVAADTFTTTRKLVAHGIWSNGMRPMIPKNVTEDQARAIIRKTMSMFDAQVTRQTRVMCGNESRPITSCVWDATNGKWQDAVAAAIREMRSPVQQYTLKAFGADTYRPRKTDLRQGMGWHLTEFPRIGRVMVINADYWRETMQRGFVVEPTEPGALSLYDPDPDGHHRELVREILSEQLVEKVVTEKAEYYTWKRDRGVPNDRPDSLVYACALTGLEGVGEEKVAKRERKRYASADLNRRGQ